MYSYSTSSSGEKPLMPFWPTNAQTSRNPSIRINELPRPSRSSFAGFSSLHAQSSHYTHHWSKVHLNLRIDSTGNDRVVINVNYMAKLTNMNIMNESFYFDSTYIVNKDDFRW